MSDQRITDLIKRVNSLPKLKMSAAKELCKDCGGRSACDKCDCDICICCYYKHLIRGKCPNADMPKLQKPNHEREFSLRMESELLKQEKKQSERVYNDEIDRLKADHHEQIRKLHIIYEGQLEQMKARLEEYKAQHDFTLDQLQAENSEISESNKTLTSDREALRAQIEELRQQFANLEEAETKKKAVKPVKTSAKLRKSLVERQAEVATKAKRMENISSENLVVMP